MQCHINLFDVCNDITNSLHYGCGTIKTFCCIDIYSYLMELSGIRSQGSTLAMVDINSQEDITQCSETSKKTFAPDSNATETTDITEASAKSDKFCIKKCFSYICLAFVISFVIAILLIPIVIYVTLSPQENSFLNDVDFQSCSVSFFVYYGYTCIKGVFV